MAGYRTVRYRTDEEVSRYDLLKLSVLLLLLALLALTWFATRDQQIAETPGGEVAATPVTDVQETLPVPMLATPTINVPTETLTPGNVTLSGTAEPGAQVTILVNDQPVGAATAGVDGAWSAVIDLPAGEYDVRVQTVDNVGTLVGESQSVHITVGEETAAPPAGDPAPPSFDPVTSTYSFSGTAGPGETITIISNGMPVGVTTADESGNWAVVVPADAITTGEVSLQATDAEGNITQESGAVQLGPRPPSLTLSDDVTVDPDSGEPTLLLTPGPFIWTGQAEPGTQVEMLFNGLRIGSADVDDSGMWSLPVNMPAGDYSMQLNSLDSSGVFLAAAPPIRVVVGDGAPTTDSGSTTESGTLDSVLASRPEEFSTLLSVLQSNGLTETLAEPGPYTVFAPTNDAFALLPQRVIDGLAANPQVFQNVLQYHIAHGRQLSADLVAAQPTTVNGRLLMISSMADTLLVNDAIITSPDTVADNGVLHAIDRILVPPLAEGVQPLIIDTSGVSTFTGTQLTIAGTAEPNRIILVEMNGEPFAQPATVAPDGTWSVSGGVTPGDYQIVAYMLDAADTLEAISRPVALQIDSP